jgi:hypothetical protein
VVRPFFERVLKREGDPLTGFDKAYQWKRLRMVGKVVALALAMVGYFLAFALASINEQVRAGRPVLAFVGAMLVRFAVWPFVYALVGSLMLLEAKRSDRFDGLIAYVGLDAAVAGSVNETDKLKCEEFLSQVHWGKLHRIVRSRFEWFTVDPPGAPAAVDKLLNESEELQEAVSQEDD